MPLQPQLVLCMMEIQQELQILLNLATELIPIMAQLVLYMPEWVE